MKLQLWSAAALPVALSGLSIVWFLQTVQCVPQGEKRVSTPLGPREHFIPVCLLAGSANRPDSPAISQVFLTLETQSFAHV